MKYAVVIFGLMMFLGFHGCATREGALRNTTHLSVAIEDSSPNRITEAMKEVMETLGYQPIYTANTQEPGFRSAHSSKVLRWIRGGSPAVSFILVPTASGWNLILAPDPDGLYPGPSSSYFKTALEAIRQKASQPSLTSH